MKAYRIQPVNITFTGPCGECEQNEEDRGAILCRDCEESPGFCSAKCPKCPTCSGTGERRFMWRWVPGEEKPVYARDRETGGWYITAGIKFTTYGHWQRYVEVKRECPHCDLEGVATCEHCGGTGEVNEWKEDTK